MNLVVNARDAMPEGGRLRIETGEQTFDGQTLCQGVPVVAGRYVRLSVADTGTGIDVETKQRLFEPFFTTKEPGKGTGLGLATVYGIVRQSQGYVFCDSEPGQGAVFRVYLPRIGAAAVAAEPQVPAVLAVGRLARCSSLFKLVLAQWNDSPRV